jgi:hypothetical protein
VDYFSLDQVCQHAGGLAVAGLAAFRGIDPTDPDAPAPSPLPS